MIRMLKLALGAKLILAAALGVGPCWVSFAQGDADLEAPGLAPSTASVSGGATLFQNVRIASTTIGLADMRSMVPPLTSTLEGAESTPLLPSKTRGMPQHRRRFRLADTLHDLHTDHKLAPSRGCFAAIDADDLACNEGCLFG